jgi:iron complex outermembrane recepter protein
MSTVSLHKLTVLRSAAAMLALAFAASAAPADEAAGPAQPGALEEIIVTASKRAESMKEVPAAITAITQADIQQLGIVSLQDYLPYVPGLSDDFAFAAGHGNVILRGISSGSQQTTPTVGFYLDDTPFTPSSSNSVGTLIHPDPDLGDVDHIEVLKGPQSTLYGASSLGGLIKIVSKQPNLTDFSAETLLEGTAVDGGGQGGHARATVNVPLINDQLAARVTGFYRFDPGFVDNVLTGQNHVNSATSYGGKLSLRWKPTDSLNVRVDYYHENINDAAIAQEDLSPTTLRPLYGNDKYSSFYNWVLTTKMDVAAATVTYDTGVGTLTSASSFAHYQDGESYDLTATFLPLVNAVLRSIRTRTLPPNTAAIGTESPGMRKATEELRFNSARFGGHWEFDAGFFYTHENVSYDVPISAFAYPTGAPVQFPAPFSFVGNTLSTAATTARYREFAGFLDADYYITDNLDLMTGYRYSSNTQTFAGNSSGFLTVLSHGRPTFASAASSSDSSPSYLFTLRYRITPDLSTYARAASAYRPGGPQFSPSPRVPDSFGPDRVWDYEVGAKSDWLDHRVDTDLAVYYMDWSNIQLNSLVGGQTVTGNGGDAVSEGVEFQAHVKPVERLVLGANFAYNETRMVVINPANLAGAERGNPLPNAPKWTTTETADYSFPLAKGFNGLVGVSYEYQGSRNSSFAGDKVNTSVVVPAYSVEDLRLGITSHTCDVTLHVNNLSNTNGITSIAYNRAAPGFPINPAAYVIPPRTFVLSLDYRL